MIVCANDNIKVKREMTELICGGDEKKFDCVIILITVFKSPLSRKHERRIDKRKKTLPVYRKFIKKTTGGFDNHETYNNKA